jgi:hypothetical protein
LYVTDKVQDEPEFRKLIKVQFPDLEKSGLATMVNGPKAKKPALRVIDLDRLVVLSA